MKSTPKRPQLTPEELQQFKWLLGGVLTLLGVSTVIFMDVDAWTLMGLTSIITVVSMIRPTLPARVPPIIHTLAFPAIVAFFVADLWFKTEILPAMVRLGILLLLYRNIGYRQRRDDLQIIVLGLFLIVVAGVLTVSLTFAVQILIYTACALALLLVVTLSDAVGPVQRPPVRFGEVPGWAQHTSWRQLFRRLREVTDWRVLGLGVVLFAGVVGVSAVIFLAIPRFQLENSMFLDRFITKKAKTGFSDEIRIGEVTDIQQDGSVALSVDVSDQTQIPASAPYWRMLVLDSYENDTFRFSSALRKLEQGMERSTSDLRGYARARLGETVHWTFFLESGVSRYLPLHGHFEALRFHESQNFRFYSALGVVALRDDPVTMTAYRVEGFELSASLPDPTFAKEWQDRPGPPNSRVSLQSRLPLFRYEADIATLRRAIGEVTGGETLPASEFSRRAIEWLRRNHNYSLSPNIPAGEGDRLIRWLGSRGAGHCELFAGSFVLMARGAGFPARVVTGFRGGSWNGFSNNFTIRNSDAHAWAEIFDPSSGAWLRADPLATTAATNVEEVRGEAAVAARMDRSWKARFDSLRVFWYRRIVSFDQRSQIETLKAVKDATQNSGRRLREVLTAGMAAFKNWMLSPWSFRRVAGIVGGLGLIALAFWLWREFGRAWWRQFGPRRGTRREDPIRRDAGRWLKKIKACAWDGGDRGGTIEELQRLRFGARHTWSEPQRVFRRARHMLRAARRSERLTRT